MRGKGKRGGNIASSKWPLIHAQSHAAVRQQRKRWKAENAMANDEWVSEFGWSNPIRWVDDGQRMKKTFLRCAVSSSRAVASRDCDHKCTVHISISFWDTSAHCFSRLSLMNEAIAAKRAAGLKTWRMHCWGHVRPHTNSRSTWRHDITGEVEWVLPPNMRKMTDRVP